MQWHTVFCFWTCYIKNLEQRLESRLPSNWVGENRIKETLSLLCCPNPQLKLFSTEARVDFHQTRAEGHHSPPDNKSMENVGITKHWMTGPKENNQFSPRPSKQNSLFPVGPVILPNCTIKKTAKSYLLAAGCHAHLPRFQCTRLVHVRVESSSCSFPRKLVLTHDMWYFLLQSENVFELGGITMLIESTAQEALLYSQIDSSSETRTLATLENDKISYSTLYLSITYHRNKTKLSAISTHLHEAFLYKHQMIQQIGCQAVLKGTYFCRYVQMRFSPGTTPKALLRLRRTILGSDRPGKLAYDLTLHMDWW